VATPLAISFSALVVAVIWFYKLFTDLTSLARLRGKLMGMRGNAAFVMF
jgi:hypothetical protein